MVSAYTPPESIAARKRAAGRKLTLIGAVLCGAGLAGVVLSFVLDALFLGVIGRPVASLAWLALIGGLGVFVWGTAMIRDARSA